VCWPDSDDNIDVCEEHDVDEICRFQILIDQLAGELHYDTQLKLVYSTKLISLDLEESGKDPCASA
jgi:hypothetical protein